MSLKPTLNQNEKTNNALIPLLYEDQCRYTKCKGKARGSRHGLSLSTCEHLFILSRKKLINQELRNKLVLDWRRSRKITNYEDFGILCWRTETMKRHNETKSRTSTFADSGKELQISLRPPRPKEFRADENMTEIWQMSETFI